MEISSVNNELGDWELLTEQALHSSDEYTHFCPTGIFDADYFSISTTSMANHCNQNSEAEEIVKHEIVPPVTVAGSDVIFDIVFEEMDDSESDEKFSSEIDHVFDVFDEPLVSAYLQKSLRDIKLFQQDVKEGQKDGEDGVELGVKNSLTKFSSSWKSTGARALFSAGMAAASMFVLVTGGNCQLKRQTKLDSKNNNKAENRGSLVARAKISFVGRYNKPLL